MNGKLLAIAVAGAVSPMGAQALDVSVSGQVNRAIRFADNGVNSDVQNVGGSASKSRFWFIAEGEMMPGITAGAHIEYGASANAGGTLDVEDADRATAFGPSDSLIYFSGDFGETTMNKAPPAGNGAMWTSVDGAWMGTEYSPDTNSGLSVANTDGTSTGYSVFSFFPSVNIIIREDTLHYDTPSIGPVKGGLLEVDVRQERPATPEGDKKLVPNLPDGYTPILRAIPSVYVRYNRDEHHVGEDYEEMYRNVAHTWGSKSVHVDYRSTENGAHMEGRTIGIGAQYSFGSGVDVYQGFNSYSFDAPGVDFEGIDALHMGSSVAFK